MRCDFGFLEGRATDRTPDKTLLYPHPAFGHLLPEDPNAGLKEKA
jgi:hypothetical protein